MRCQDVQEKNGNEDKVERVNLTTRLCVHHIIENFEREKKAQHFYHIFSVCIVNNPNFCLLFIHFFLFISLLFLRCSISSSENILLTVGKKTFRSLNGNPYLMNCPLPHSSSTIDRYRTRRTAKAPAKKPQTAGSYNFCFTSTHIHNIYKWKSEIFSLTLSIWLVFIYFFTFYFVHLIFVFNFIPNVFQHSLCLSVSLFLSHIHTH